MPLPKLVTEASDNYATVDLFVHLVSVTLIPAFVATGTVMITSSVASARMTKSGDFPKKGLVIRPKASGTSPAA